MFLAVAGDDPTGAFESLYDQHNPVELHVFVVGGHCFCT